MLAVAQLAGIMAAKKTPDLIPLCHPLALISVDVKLTLDEKRNAVDIEATCKLKGRTGVEMEALTAASVAALTVYDMCKSVDRGMVISDVRSCISPAASRGRMRRAHDTPHISTSLASRRGRGDRFADTKLSSRAQRGTLLMATGPSLARDDNAWQEYASSSSPFATPMPA